MERTLSFVFWISILICGFAGVNARRRELSALAGNQGDSSVEYAKFFGGSSKPPPEQSSPICVIARQNNPIEDEDGKYGRLMGAHTLTQPPWLVNSSWTKIAPRIMNAATIPSPKLPRSPLSPRQSPPLPPPPTPPPPPPPPCGPTAAPPVRRLFLRSSSSRLSPSSRQVIGCTTPILTPPPPPPTTPILPTPPFPPTTPPTGQSSGGTSCIIVNTGRSSKETKLESRKILHKRRLHSLKLRRQLQTAAKSQPGESKVLPHST